MPATIVVHPRTADARRNAVVASLRALAAGLVRVHAVWRDRREVRALAELDDKMLKDIGLSRSDVYGALTTPLDRAPSRLLVEDRDRRRRAP